MRWSVEFAPSLTVTFAEKDPKDSKLGVGSKLKIPWSEIFIFGSGSILEVIAPPIPEWILQ